MAVSLQLGVEGIGELTAGLNRLGHRATEVIEPAVAKAAGVVLEASRAMAPVDDGTLRDALVSKVKRYRETVVVAIVGADVRRAPHAHLVELGTGPRITTEGRFAGAMPANPFMRRAYAQTSDQVQRVMEDEVRLMLEQNS